MSDEIKAPLLGRDGMGVAIEVRKAEDKTVRLTFPASSEAPVERWFGEEILSHDRGAIRMDRIERGAMPLLFNHNWDEPVGVVDGARVENNRLVVDAHLFATARAQEIAAMVEGGLRNVSIGYRLHVVEEDKKAARFTATDWEPFEVSIVTVPADPSVGIGRQLGGNELEVRMVRASQPPAKPAVSQGGTKVSDENNAAAGASAEQKIEVRAEGGDNSRSGPNAVQMEQMRKKAIENFAKANRIEGRTVDYWINSGISVDQVSDDILRILEERGKTNPQSAAALGMSRKEAERFSLTRAIKACAENNWTNAPFELECSRSVATKLGKTNDAQRFFVPFEVLQRSMPTTDRRDLNTTLPSAGGYLVATESNGFVELLRNRSVVFALGARRLSGLVGNVSIPKQTGSGTAYWLGTESSTITESQQTFQQLAMTPKTVGAYTEISRNLLLQSSPAADGIANEDLAKTVAIAVDLASLSGSGVAGQPIGLVNTSGIGSVTGTSFSYAKALEFQTDVAAANVVPARGAYVTTPVAAAVVMQKQRFTSTDTPLWEGNVWDGRMIGFPAMSTNQLSDGMIFGDWNELVIGEWGVLEVEVNPYANFTAGIIGIRAIYSMDVGVRRPAAFSYASSITA